MIFINYLINNLNKYYRDLDNQIITNLCSNDCNKEFDIPHINLYGNDGSMKNYYAYYIVNKLCDVSLKKEDFKLENKNIKINNNNIDFNIYTTKYFRELNLFHKINYDKVILKNYLLETIQIKNFSNRKHIIILKDFDKLSFNCYMCLRRILETYSNNVIFISISSNLSKIPDSIQSRFLNIRCPMIEKKKLNIFIKNILKDYYNDTEFFINSNQLNNKEINKLIKNNENDIYKILLNLETVLFNVVFTYKDYISDIINKHLKFLKKEKNGFKLITKNREFIYKIIQYNENNSLILEKFVNIIIKNYQKYLSIIEVIKLTAQIDYDIIYSSRELYHYEKYLIKLYSLFHNS